MHVAAAGSGDRRGGDGDPERAEINDAWRLGALNVVTTLTGSALLALALAAGRLTTDEAWTAAHVDEDWNMRFWGRDEVILHAPRLSLRRDAGGGGCACGAALGFAGQVFELDRIEFRCAAVAAEPGVPLRDTRGSAAR